jgi:protein O-mannosyl-transferase
MSESFRAPSSQRIWLLLALLTTIAVYLVGLKGGFVFDDFPNIVDNGVLLGFANGPGGLAAAIFSSASSDIQRPLAMLSFIANLATSGLDPLPMKVLNLAIHLLNGVLLYRLTQLLVTACERRADANASSDYFWLPPFVAAAWLLAPINFIPVLYVVQRMESLSHTFVFLALIVYCNYRLGGGARPLSRALAVHVPLLVLAGLLVKESAALTLLYAFLIEVLLLVPAGNGDAARERHAIQRYFVAVLWLPAVLGGLFLWWKFGNADVYATRPFTLGERLLTQLRVVAGYIDWTLLPRLSALGLYHDDIVVSKGLLKPVSTLLSLFGLLALVTFAVMQRRRRPLVALGILLFFAAQPLTATFLPLDLAYEHRNYFASYGLLLAAGSELAVRRSDHAMPFIRSALAFVLLALFVPTTFKRALEWSHPLSLATAEAQRRPQSPRATYELGRTYVVLAHANPGSTNYTDGAFEALERAAKVPNATTLPEQALLILASRANVPVRQEWWDSFYAKLRAAPPDVSDNAALFAVFSCVRRKECRFDERQMISLFGAALAHEPPSPEVLTIYASYAINQLSDARLGLRLLDDSVALRPRNTQFRQNRAELLIAMGRKEDAKKDIAVIEGANRFGRETTRLQRLRSAIASDAPPRFPAE